MDCDTDATATATTPSLSAERTAFCPPDGADVVS